ncbi:hypothetical protein BDV93DRAFT_556113 [Ceratobasidium sp. AG-I]|nr:hypothetical protein BDV93DRAFT_556113 [Ceratobasidium sp. AG-I]
MRHSDQSFLFSIHISYDGSFHLVRKNKSSDEHDICSSDGTKYFVEQSAYRKHLEANSNGSNPQSSQGADCNNHRAANGMWAKMDGLAETGLGACSCGRHTVMLKQSVVNYFKGERFAYTDYAIGSAIHTAVQDGATSIGVFYDIFCHWSRNWESRLPTLLLPAGPLSLPPNFFGGIPKYHLAGHVDACYARFSLNNMTGVGRLDAEGCERAWANLNQAAGSTSEKGHGSRIEALNHCMQDWNWKKTVGIITHLLKKHKEALRMSREQEDMWNAFHSLLSRDLTSKWEGLSTEPERINGKWTSVFLMSSTPEASVTQMLLTLNKAEAVVSSGEDSLDGGYTGPAWILEGIELETQQNRVKQELSSLGSSPTAKQALELFNMRSALSSRIIRHRKDTSHFIDIRVSSMDSSSVQQASEDGKPEAATLCLPSQMANQLSHTERTKRLVQVEIKLRRAKCLQALQRLRTTALQKAQMLLAKKSKQKPGQVQKTRTQSMIDRLTDRIKGAISDYTSSRRALLILSSDDKDSSTFQSLAETDTSGLMTVLCASREPGEGYKHVPWYWNVRPAGQQPGAAAHLEEVEASRVEWFRGRERFRRWQEEELILRREMATVVFDFEHRRQQWIGRSVTSHADYNAGYKSYCLKQADLWLSLRQDAFSRVQQSLQLEPNIALCTRAIKVFA